jgi:hypothetical protein
MNGELVMQGALLVRTGMDVVKAALSFRPQRLKEDKIPVYGLVTRAPRLMRAPGAPGDLAQMRWPR